VRGTLCATNSKTGGSRKSLKQCREINKYNKMKKILMIVNMVLSINAFAQISLDNTTNDYSNHIGPSNTILTNGGFKFIKTSSDSMILCNTDHSVFKTILIPSITVASNFSATPISPISFHYVSDNLFDTDSEIEYIAVYKAVEQIGFETFNDTLTVALIDETNGIIQVLDSYGRQNLNGPSMYSEYYFLSFYSDGSSFAKLQVAANILPSPKYFSLPGLPACNSCSSSPEGFNTNPSQTQSHLFPNPTSGEITIEFDEAKGIIGGDLHIYNINGTLVTTKKITGDISNIKIETNGIQSGTYLCKVFDRNSKQISTNKFIKIN
jgi:hypothetical protein